ncbi:protein OSB2, chloroplastic-like [Cornus florida]|uniref:protein OSB2, chloroplastic-like n=1 Tax=Cornus florida TaxID=4283 RepID=UPI0028985BBE|nr:protein OSB2, chloroplastic-like [Cornus florida]
MNFLRRAIAGGLVSSSSSSPRKCLLLSIHRVRTLQHYSYSSTTHYEQKTQTALNPKAEPHQSSSSPSWLSGSEMVQKKAKDWPRPKEIPFQAKVANSVSLIGRVHIPVQFQVSPDGQYWAGTIITQQDYDDKGDNASDYPSFWIPLIFEGDLAHIAYYHLKKEDYVHITGQLSADQPQITISEIQAHSQSRAHAQVMVRSVDFVEHSSKLKKSSASCQKEEKTISSASMSKDGDSALSSWRDLVTNPARWWDHRENKINGLVKPKHPDFKHKDSGLALWINMAPKWVQTDLKGLKFDVQPHGMKQVKEGRASMSEKGDPALSSWSELLKNPERWWDHRQNKLNGLVKPNYPDFKHKDSGLALWIDRAPKWFLTKLEGLEFDVQPPGMKQVKGSRGVEMRVW